MERSKQPSPFDVPLRKVVSFKLKAIRKGASVGALHQLLADSGADHVVVVDERGRALGLVSRSEACARAAEGDARTLASVMSAGVVAVAPAMSVAEASALMVRRSLQALVVRHGDRYGALFPDDVVRFVAAKARRP